MKKKSIEKLLDLADWNDGYVSVAEAKGMGIAQTYLSEGEEAGIFQKAAKGLYIKKGYPIDPFYILHFRYRKAVFCLHSALYLHGFHIEPVLEVALPRNYMTAGIEGAGVLRKGADRYLLGQSLAVSPHGPLVPVYDIEMTIVDLILYRDRFLDEEYASILDEAKAKNIDKEKLFTYARTLDKFDLVDAATKGRI